MQKFLNNNWEANLIDPNQLGKFVTHSNEYETKYPTLHEKFKVNRIEKFRPYMKFPLPPHRKPVHDFIFIEKGSAKRNMGLDSYHITENTFCFLPAYQILADETMTEDIKGYYGHFSIELFTSKFFQKEAIERLPFLRYNAFPVVKVPKESVAGILSTLRRLEIEFDAGAPNGIDIISAHLLALFIELYPYTERQVNTPKDSISNIVQRYKDLLVENIYNYQKVADYASMLSITPNHLNRCVKKTLGKTARDVLFDMFLLEAKVLLKQSDLSISEIAYKLGNRDSSDFARFFKSKLKMSPKEYRQQE